jgi:hypothetical protein
MSAVLLPKTLDDYRVGELLAVWERWMLQPAKDVMELGYPKTACGCHSEPWGYWEHTFQDECDEMENAKADAVNAAIDDLETLQQMAVYHKHLAGVYRFNRNNLDGVYNAARLALAYSLPARGVY